ncbi:hypothetical protein D1818_05940 [Aquimarina sp. BL5]|nr:hypothetical protein D1818_05940 [Aquimarina sp. BL5]RKN06381.1 hypothetical protein D7036_09170 [Aquimarina sp. BL5]
MGILYNFSLKNHIYKQFIFLNYHTFKKNIYTFVIISTKHKKEAVVTQPLMNSKLSIFNSM